MNRSSSEANLLCTEYSREVRTQKEESGGERALVFPLLAGLRHRKLVQFFCIPEPFVGGYV